mmetsp:Transcript_8143/g.17017  ORF Transcript_8143/g.17017 Transcript_8143/m.17017 type:complete len:244 (-) Transcript_8143:293-1024(-)
MAGIRVAPPTSTTCEIGRPVIPSLTLALSPRLPLVAKLSGDDSSAFLFSLRNFFELAANSRAFFLPLCCAFFLSFISTSFSCNKVSASISSSSLEVADPPPPSSKKSWNACLPSETLSISSSISIAAITASGFASPGSIALERSATSRTGLSNARNSSKHKSSIFLRVSRHSTCVEFDVPASFNSSVTSVLSNINTSRAFATLSHPSAVSGNARFAALLLLRKILTASAERTMASATSPPSLR